MKQYKLNAGAQFQELQLDTVSHGTINLKSPQAGFDWRMIVVYRGKHCPLCTRYLLELEELKQSFYDLGIDLVAVSADSKEQVTGHLSEMPLSFPIAYGIDVNQMQQLGLYISTPRSPQETEHPFAEPGIFVINSDGNLQLVDISNGPFARPDLTMLIKGLEYIRNPANNYPIRGTYTSAT